MYGNNRYKGVIKDRPRDRQHGIHENLRAARIVPVIVIKDLGHAVPLAKALVEGGLDVLEITLRSPVAAWQAIEEPSPPKFPAPSWAPAP